MSGGEDVAHRGGFRRDRDCRVVGVHQEYRTPGPTTETTAANAAKVDAIANTVPEDIKSSGKLVVGVNVPTRPTNSRIRVARSSASMST